MIYQFKKNIDDFLVFLLLFYAWNEMKWMNVWWIGDTIRLLWLLDSDENLGNSKLQSEKVASSRGRLFPPIMKQLGNRDGSRRQNGDFPLSVATHLEIINDIADLKGKQLLE